MKRSPTSMALSTGVTLPVIAVMLLFTQRPVEAGITPIDFEGLPDSTILTTQFPSLTFSNAIILTAGITLNEFEFPPHSGSNVASDNGGRITIVFSTPVTSFSGYFTYAEPLTIRAFNSQNSQVAIAVSKNSNNEMLSGVSGNSPNELIQVSSNAGISSVTIAGDPNGTSFTMDDISYSSPVTVPALSLIGLASLALILAATAVLSTRGRAASARLVSLLPVLSVVGCVLYVWPPASAQAPAHALAESSNPSVFDHLTVSQPVLMPGRGRWVTVRIRINHPRLIADSINLLGSGTTGIPTASSHMRPDLKQSGGYEGKVNISNPTVRLCVSVALRGQLRRVLSTIQTKP